MRITSKSDEAETPTEGQLAQEQLLGLTELAKQLPKINGRRPSVCTLWRWCLKGIDGVRMEHVRRGKAIATTVSAVDRFSAALAQHRVEQLPQEGGPHIARKRATNPAARRKSIEEAERILREAGI